jgi:predicted SAM-dependent methyltransferase
MNLKNKLINDNKLNWLDIGCGGNFEEGFQYIDTFAEDIICPRYRNKYRRLDIVNCNKKDLISLGQFDFIRLQHTLEHFSYEEGNTALRNCASILKPKGIILITVPDLRIHIKKYLNDEYKNWNGYKLWAKKRIQENSPPSFYFSIFAHSMPFEQHKWCYDFEGVAFQLDSIGKFKDIIKLGIDDPLSDEPFTHNRPEEDLCVIATKIF